VRSRLWFAAALCLVVSSSVVAQKEPKMSAEEKAMMEAMEKAVAPGPEHKLLNGTVGTWNTVVKFYPAPGAPAYESTGVSKNQMILGGRYLEQRFKGNSMGKPFEGIGYTGYDKVRKQYVGTWIDSMSTGVMMSTGTEENGGKNWSYVSTMDDPMSGQSYPVTQKMTIVDKNKHVFEMWSPARDGSTYKSMEITYTRKK
jgi:uncharacterized protein DUF1579